MFIVTENAALRSSRTENDSATNPNICQFVSIRVNSWDSGPVWNRGIKRD